MAKYFFPLHLTQAKVDGPLLHRSKPNRFRMICDCLEEENAVLWLFWEYLGNVVDTKGLRFDPDEGTVQNNPEESEHENDEEVDHENDEEVDHENDEEVDHENDGEESEYENDWEESERENDEEVDHENDEEESEHEDDGDESKEETVENENGDAVVDTRSVEIGVENAGEEMDVE